ncbi:MAG: phosphotransferase [Herpetosiphonaceae bacterium]|nr:phosphotransferase [Herpetosiphonaceae bacterium]
MLTPPDISDDIILACVHANFGLPITHATFLPIGADINSFVYRLTSDDGTPYFLKLRRGNFNEVAVTVPAFLYAQGIHRVMAPFPTITHRWWVHAHDFDWMLYPFFAGKNGFEVALSQPQWLALGESMKAVHSTILPPGLVARVPRETYSPRLRRIVETFDDHVEQPFDDHIAARLAAFWLTKRDEIHCIVQRAEQLAHLLQHRTVDLVVCHADLHGGNVLLSAHDTLAIVDWDELILAPKERDLMFVGGGIGGIWNLPQETLWFYQAYGHTEIDPVGLAYYRYERIVADIAAYGEQIFGIQGSADDREQGLRELMAQFLPNDAPVVQIAHKSYQALS